VWNCFRKLFLSSKTEKGTKQVLSVCRTVYKFCAFNYSWYLFPVMAWLEMRMHLWIQSAPRIWSSDGKQKLVPASMQIPWLLILTGIVCALLFEWFVFVWFSFCWMSAFLFCSDGKLEIVVPSFVHYLEVLEGADGDKMPGKRMWGFTIFLIVVGLGWWCRWAWDIYRG